MRGKARRGVEWLIALVVRATSPTWCCCWRALLTEESSNLSAAQLLASGGVVWLTNVIVFGLWYWWYDAGGPVRRAMHGRKQPDFQFPQDDNRQTAAPGWYPRLEDYVYVALTNGIAFSPTDSMPLTRVAKRLMALDSTISVAAMLLVAAARSTCWGRSPTSQRPELVVQRRTCRGPAPASAGSRAGVAREAAALERAPHRLGGLRARPGKQHARGVAVDRRQRRRQQLDDERQREPLVRQLAAERRDARAVRDHLGGVRSG